MNLLEYEAKNVLRLAHIAVPRSTLVTYESDQPELPVVLKSQVPVGGRGKAGGVRLIEEPQNFKPAVSEILALAIKGLTPKVLLAEEKLDIQHEYYLSLLINREKAEIQLMAHKNGGVEVEGNAPTSFLTITLNRTNTENAGERVAEYFELPNQSFALQDMINHLYRCFIQNDITLLEINPLVYTADNQLIAGDCKIELDDAAVFRHPEWHFEAEPKNTNFVTLDPDGNVATIANGAGLAMATVDAVADLGMNPANFLDIGGGANSDSVLAAFRKIVEYPQVKAIVINIFAGITRCDEVAKAIIEARQHIAALPPLYIRLAGTNVDLAQGLLSRYSVPLLPTLESCLKAAKQEITHG